MHTGIPNSANYDSDQYESPSDVGMIEKPVPAAAMTVPISLVFIFTTTLWRIICLRFDTTDLFVDEAQYWLWSTHLDLGYYSKPPMIAWIIHLVTWFSGSSSIFWIRISGPVLHMLTALMLMRSARHFGNGSFQAWTGVTFITLPGVAFSSVFFSTDVVLLVFFAVALWAYLGLTKRRSLPLAIIFGLAFAGAFMSKYAILFVVPGGLLALLFLPVARIGWRDFFVASTVAIIGCLPNLWWNFENQLTTVRHTESIAGWSALSLHPLGAIGFFAAQFGVVGPIIFFAILWAGRRLLQSRSDEREKLLFWLSFPVVLLITLQALMAKAYANWAVTAYVAGTILAVLILHALWPKGLRHSLVINGVVSLLLPIGIVFSHQLSLPGGVEIFKRYTGRSDISREAEYLATLAKLDTIVSDDRDLLADMHYTLRNDPLKIYARPRMGPPTNYYQQVFALPPATDRPVLMVTMTPFTCSSSDPALVKSWVPTSGNYKGKRFYAYATSSRCLAL